MDGYGFVKYVSSVMVAGNASVSPLILFYGGRQRKCKSVDSLYGGRQRKCKAVDFC